MTTIDQPPPSVPTGELVRGTLADFTELCRIEIALARGELLVELGRAKQAGIALGIAGMLLGSALSLLLFALVLVQPNPSRSALVAAAIVAASSLALVLWGRARLPTSLLGGARKRLEQDVKLIKEATR
jgi:Putative Actinobacterial Holin-X, holin superfamily III